MKCVEFESRLNHVLDERLSPSLDRVLTQHAQACAGCSDLLAAHEALLEGVATLPSVRLGQAEMEALAHRIVVEVGDAPPAAFRRAGQVDVAVRGPLDVAERSFAPWAIVGVVLATAAALLIVLLPGLRNDQAPNAPVERPQQIVESGPRPPLETEPRSVGPRDFENLPLIARVGYEVADGLTPVTNSMVSAYREWRKRPFFRGADDPQRSSYFAPSSDATLA